MTTASKCRYPKISQNSHRKYYSPTEWRCHNDVHNAMFTEMATESSSAGSQDVVGTPSVGIMTSSQKQSADGFFAVIYSTRLISPLTSYMQSITKGHYLPVFAPISSTALKYFLSIVSSYPVKKNFSSSIVRVISVVSLLSIIVSLNLLSPVEAIPGVYQQSHCETHGWNAFPVWKYRAEPRWVAPMNVDRELQWEFLELFRGGDRRSKYSSSSEEDSYEDLPLDIDELKRVADMCPKDAFFYSLSPKHLAASASIARMLVAQHSPAEVLMLSRALIRSPYVNPKVWYHGIIGAAQERPDMTGFKLAHPIDAIPDLFIPGPFIFEVMDKYRKFHRRSGSRTNSTTVVHREKRSPLSISLSKRKLGKQKNATISDTIRKTEVGRSSNAKVIQKNGRNSITSKQQKTLKESESKQRTMLHSLSSINKNTNNKRKKLSKSKTKADIAAAIGNVTEYQADSRMWKRAKIDAFDDCIVVDGSATVHNGIENKLWYFRQDAMINQHHFYWHQEYPLNSTRHRPRRGELFFYMHRNLIARYNAERLSNGLPLVEIFDIRPGAEIKSAFDSLLADINSGKFWTPRPHGVHFTNILHMKDPDFERNIFVGHYNELYGRLVRSIEVGSLLMGPIKTLKIDHTKGIEPLGNTVEASQLSVNPLFYDAMGFHNLGHQIIGLATDPKFKRKLPTGVMADTITTMRDPEFYSYHTVVDNLFDMYKKTLPPYQPHGGEYPLRWNGVEILDVEVVPKNAKHGPNHLTTFWGNRRYRLAPGVDRSIHKGDLDVDICAVHLDHEPFDFKITVTLDPCAKTKSNKGSVRIFLAPRYDEHGNRYPLRIQRRLMIHMDTFPVDLRVGRNVIYRRSYDSNVVSPWTKHFKDYENSPKHPRSADFCGCGWPTHMYIPKGSPKGTHFDIFVMLTNYDHDYVEENPADESIPEPCNSPYMYCGVKWRQYPDAKPMGYPFDRLPFSVPLKCPKYGTGPLWSYILCKLLQIVWDRQVSSLEEYVSFAPNMASTVVTITHLDQLVW